MGKRYSIDTYTIKTEDLNIDVLVFRGVMEEPTTQKFWGKVGSVFGEDINNPIILDLTEVVWLNEAGVSKVGISSYAKKCEEKNLGFVIVCNRDDEVFHNFIDTGDDDELFLVKTIRQALNILRADHHFRRPMINSCPDKDTDPKRFFQKESFSQLLPDFDGNISDDFELEILKIEYKSIQIKLIGNYFNFHQSPFEREIKKMIAGFNYLIFDLSELTYIFNHGYVSFVGFIKKLKEKEGDIAFINTNPDIYDYFKILGFARFFNFFDTYEEAYNFLNTHNKLIPNIIPNPEPVLQFTMTKEYVLDAISLIPDDVPKKQSTIDYINKHWDLTVDMWHRGLGHHTSERQSVYSTMINILLMSFSLPVGQLQLENENIDSFKYPGMYLYNKKK